MALAAEMALDAISHRKTLGVECAENDFLGCHSEFSYGDGKEGF